MRILLAAPLGGITGGISRWTEHFISYYNHLMDKECSLETFSMSRNQFVNINSSLIYRLLTGVKDYYTILRRFRKEICANDYDIIHLVSSASISLLKDLYIIQYAKRKCIKTIIHFHFGRIDELSKKKNWEWRMLVNVIQKVDCVIVIDKKSDNTLKQCGFNNIALLPNPIAPRVNEIVMQNSNLKITPRTILFTGHVIRTKGIYELINACKEIDNIKLKLVGHIEENMRNQLSKMVGDVTWLEICGEMSYEYVIKEMLSCDIFVLPTYTEGFPNVILESMACGCAIVSTTVGAIPEMLEEEAGSCYGLMVKPKDTVQLQAVIEKMLNDEVLKKECRLNVKKRVFERYNISSVWEQLMEVWKKTYNCK